MFGRRGLIRSDRRSRYGWGVRFLQSMAKKHGKRSIYVMWEQQNNKVMTAEEQKQFTEKICEWLRANYDKYDRAYEQFDIEDCIGDLMNDFASDKNV